MNIADIANLVGSSWFANLASSVALVLSCLAIQQTSWKNKQDSKLERRLNRVEANELLHEALDLMNGNVKGSETVTIKNTPLSEYENRCYEQARRNIEKALTLFPENYLGHQYMGIYCRQLEYHEKALYHRQRAVNLLENDLGQIDGWPYHDLASSLAESNHLDEAEKYFKKAIDVEPSDAYLHEGYARFRWHYRKLEEAEYNKLLDDARELAKKSGRKLLVDRPKSDQQ